MLAPSASDEMLRRQFQQLQDQQQKRLLQQQQQRQQEKTKKNMEEGSTASNLSFGIEDDLDLKASAHQGQNKLTTSPAEAFASSAKVR